MATRTERIAELRIAGTAVFMQNLSMPGREKLDDFNAWRQKHMAGDETGQVQIFLDRPPPSLQSTWLS